MGFYFDPEDYDELDIEELRERVIIAIEAAFFCGIGPALFDIDEAKYADDEQLIELARRWGEL